MKSEKVFFLFIIRPPSCHAFPSSLPPRTWATATITPRSSRLSDDEEKKTVLEIPYAPYPCSSSAAVPSLGTPFR